MIGCMPKENRRRVAALWRAAVETRLGRQGRISVQPNQNPKVSTGFLQRWPPN